jgi:TolB-like protein/Flp pilus assembly protein TadD
MANVKFGPFQFDVSRRELTRDGVPVELGTKALEILIVLLEANGGLVTKDDLMSRVWPGLVVEENNIQVHVSALRKALQDGKHGPAFIVTVPGRGYRFVAASAAPDVGADAAARPALTLPEKPSIAVLPFVNLSGDIEQEYFGDGISEDIITALANYRWFFVIARNSSFSYKPRAADVKTVARELGVRYVLEGSVRRAGNRVRIAAQLVDASAGTHIWAERFDRDVTDIFAIQDEITERVAGAIEPELLRAEGGRATQQVGKNLSAWDLVRQGTWYFHQLTETTHLRSRELFREAVKLDPQMAEAQVWLARSGTSIVAYGWCENEAQEMQEAMEAARRAVQLDEKDAYAQYALSMAHIFSGEMDPAIRLAGKSVEISPSFALGHLALGMSRLYAGRADEAIEPMRRGLRLNPFDPQNFHWFRVLALALYFSGNKEEALSAALKALNIRPTWPFTLETVCVCCASLDRLPEARRYADQMRQGTGPKRDPVRPMKMLNPKWATHMEAMLRKAQS